LAANLRPELQKLPYRRGGHAGRVRSRSRSRVPPYGSTIARTLKRPRDASLLEGVGRGHSRSRSRNG